MSFKLVAVLLSHLALLAQPTPSAAPTKNPWAPAGPPPATARPPGSTPPTAAARPPGPPPPAAAAHPPGPPPPPPPAAPPATARPAARPTALSVPPRPPAPPVGRALPPPAAPGAVPARPTAALPAVRPERRPAQTPNPAALANANGKKVLVMDLSERSTDAARGVSSTVPRERVWTPPKPDLDEVDYSEEQQINRRLEKVRQRKRLGH